MNNVTVYDPKNLLRGGTKKYGQRIQLNRILFDSQIKPIDVFKFNEFYLIKVNIYSKLKISILLLLFVV